MCTFFHNKNDREKCLAPKIKPQYSSSLKCPQYILNTLYILEYCSFKLCCKNNFSQKLEPLIETYLYKFLFVVVAIRIHAWLNEVHSYTSYGENMQMKYTGAEIFTMSTGNGDLVVVPKIRHVNFNERISDFSAVLSVMLCRWIFGSFCIYIYIIYSSMNGWN